MRGWLHGFFAGARARIRFPVPVPPVGRLIGQLSAPTPLLPAETFPIRKLPFGGFQEKGIRPRLIKLPLIGRLISTLPAGAATLWTVPRVSATG